MDTARIIQKRNIHFIIQRREGGKIKTTTNNKSGDFLFFSSNPEGIPDLDMSMQGDYVDFPLAWGSQARVKSFSGRLIHFYVDDNRFNVMGNAVEYGSHFWKLWERPDYVWSSGAPSFIEANFSTANSQPYSVALHQIYKKRWLSRYWQSKGMRCFVDLNVCPRYQDINLLGVGLGWKSYATRVHKNDSLQSISDQAALAESQAGTDKILFVVYGHRKEIEALCQKQGWIYVSEDWSKPDQAKAKKRAEIKALQNEIIITDERRNKQAMTLEAWC